MPSVIIVNRVTKCEINSGIPQAKDEVSVSPYMPGSEFDNLLLLLVCVSFTIIGQPRNSVLIRRV